MNEIDAMTLLAKANPVQVEDLTPLDSPGRVAGRLPIRRLSLAIAAVAVIATATALATVYSLDGSNDGRRVHHRGGLGQMLIPQGATGGTGPGATGGTGPVKPTDPTTAFYEDGPTGATGPTRTNATSGTAGPADLADAREALGAPLVLPDVSPVDPSGIDKVVKDCGESSQSKACDVGIGFLGQRVWIYYQPAAQWSRSSDPLAAYKNSLKYDPRLRIVYLSGTPALTSQNGRNIEFLIDDVHIRIWVVDPVPTGGPTIQDIAQSIVDRSK
jgi:hypothetical protein